MKYLLLVSTLALALILCLSCGQPASPSHPDALPPGQKYSLMLFVAPWCSTCKEEVPKIHQSLSSKTSLKSTLIVVSGELPSTPSTSEIAAVYAKQLGWKLGHQPDLNLTLYRKYFPNKVQTLPSAAILNEDGVLVKIMGPRFLNAYIKNLVRDIP